MEEPSVEVANEHRFGGEGVLVDRDIPVISLDQDPAVLDDQLWEAAADIGFFQVADFDIEQSMIDDAFGLAARFFDLPEETKARRIMPPGSNSGWESRSQRRPSTGTLDEKETFQVTRSRMDSLDLWPSEDELPGFAASMLAFEASNWELAMRILASFARKLGFVETFFADVHDPVSAEYQSTLRLLHYLPIHHQLPDGVWRAGAHTDYDCLTLLHQRPGQRGLQVSPGAEAAVRNDEPLRWTDVEPRVGTVTCNIGDMLTRWSDDDLRSTLHRVAMPGESERRQPRYSIAFFAQANCDAIIQGPAHTYDPISAADFLQGRLAANFNADDARSP